MTVNNTSLEEPPVAVCPACHNDEVRNLGELPDFAFEAAEAWSAAGMRPGHLFQCSRCRLQFRAPLPRQSQLLRQYESLSAEHWMYGERAIWYHIRRALEPCSKRSILDVGCFRGDFLSWLGDGWHLFGIEPSDTARGEARANGIRIVANNIDDLKPEGEKYGAITMIDVIEHLSQPLDALHRLSRLLHPGGKLIIFTGSTDSLSWRFGGRHYWYSALPEHVSFFCPSWFHWAAPQIGCALHTLERHAHRPTNLLLRLDESIKNIFYLSYQRLKDGNRVGRYLANAPILRRFARWKVSWWTSAKDHILTTLVRNPDQ